MDLQSLANLGEVVGAAALERVSAMQSALSQDGEISRVFASGVQDTSKLAPLERIRFTWALKEIATLEVNVITFVVAEPLSLLIGAL